MRALLTLFCAIAFAIASCKVKDSGGKATGAENSPQSPAGSDSSGDLEPTVESASSEDPPAETTDSTVGSDTTTSDSAETDNSANDRSLTTPKNFKLAMIGDQGTTADSIAVLELIKNEASDLLVIAGDLDYKYSPNAWDKMLQDRVGDMPVLAAVGNHDSLIWGAYAKKLQARMNNMTKAKCEGETGVKQKCIYDGLLLAISGVGTVGNKHEEFLDKTLKSTDAAFKICVWHRNQRRMQTGDKDDETGWAVYETCREQGAMIFTAHEHAYSRTHLLSNFEEQAIVNKDSHMVLQPGQSFAFVSGLGGKEVRPEVTEDDWWRKLKAKAKGNAPEKKNGDWFAKIYTATQNAKSGALFCEFHVDDNPRKAHCYFKNIAGEVVDDFTLESKVGPGVQGIAAATVIGDGQEPVLADEEGDETGESSD